MNSSTGKFILYRRVSKIAKSDCFFRHVCLSVCPYALNNSAPTGRIFVKFDICVFFENLSILLKT